MHNLRGEASYLDLCSGRRPFIALLTSRLYPKHGKELRWTLDAGLMITCLPALWRSVAG